MKRLAALLVATCCITPVFAQSPDPVAVVAHVLDLSSDQITVWSDILHARQAALEPLAQQAQEVLGEPKAMLEALGSERHRHHQYCQPELHLAIQPEARQPGPRP